MSAALLLVQFAPLLGAALLLGLRGLPRAAIAPIGVGSVAIAALAWTWLLQAWLAQSGFGAAAEMAQAPSLHVPLWTWIAVEGFTVGLALQLDGLALTMVGVITGIGALIHLYASWYMREDPALRRFFAYMNLFVAAMLLLVLADDLLGLYLGWEGVGLCSYLLIGFWAQEPANAAAARKAFVTTRVGDTLLAIGLLLLWREFGTLHIDSLLAAAPARWGATPADPTLLLVCLLLLGGAVGKSAQLPLQAWLPDAMAGPTPVSALIHAATMVTAGVYLIARLHPLYALSPTALLVVGWVGALTLLLAAGAALVQRDIKRILAYSTISQIGYMFLALGAGAYAAAIFHMYTHAFFKALLFLAAGSVISALHHEQDLFRMGGLARKLPWACAAFVAGGAALAAVPWISAGFYSKDAILFAAWAGPTRAWWVLGVAGALLTGLYTFRLIFIAFTRPAPADAPQAHDAGDWRERLPLGLLILGALGAGFVSLPARYSLPLEEIPHPTALLLAQLACGLAGIALAWWLYQRRGLRDAQVRGWRAWARAGWGFDALYGALLVRPWQALAEANRRDVVDRAYAGLAGGAQALHRLVSRTQTASLRQYAQAFAAGLILLLAWALWQGPASRLASEVAPDVDSAAESAAGSPLRSPGGSTAASGPGPVTAPGTASAAEPSAATALAADRDTMPLAARGAGG